MVARIRKTSHVLSVVLLCTIVIALVAAQPLFAPTPPIPFLIAGSAIYENGVPCGNFTVGVTNLNTSGTWDADTSHNHYKLVLNRSDLCSGDVLQFDSINTDASTTNTSTYTVSDADQVSLIHNITFESVDAIVLILDSDETIHCMPVFMNNKQEATILNATAIACDLLKMVFESGGGNVTRINGIKNPIAHLYDFGSDEWTNVSEDHLLTTTDVIVRSCEDAELPALLPDLSVSGDLTVGSDPHAHFETTVKATVMNRGATASGGFYVVLVDNGEVIDLRTLPSLSPLEEATVSFDWVPEDAGDHTIRIEIDYDDQVNEWYDDNNVISGDVVVGETLVIRVPDDYPTIQRAVDNSTAYTMIHIDEGDYESRLTITNREHLKILGSGEDTRIIVHGSPAGRSRPNLIGIVGSSDIELDGFAVRVDSSYGGRIEPQGWRAISIQESEKISLTNLLLTHASWCDRSFLIRIEGSTDCLIADNFISGSLSPAEWARHFATSGILITSDSDNNTIYNNVICDCRYTIKVQGTNNTIYANSLFFADASSYTENRYAIDSGNNIWNSTVPLSYTFNNTTTVNYIGNYWDGWTGEDLDDDGIWDTPYEINDTTRDFHPIRKPYSEEYHLKIRSITLPQRAYAGVKDRVTVVTLSFTPA